MDDTALRERPRADASAARYIREIYHAAQLL
jgi:hypothetical protein